MAMIFRNETEKEIAELAVVNYRNWQRKCRSIKELLSTKKFPYGTYVTRVRSNHFDRALQIPEVGKVIWYEEKQGYYRVRFDNDNAWVGVNEEDLEVYEGPIPQDVSDYDIQDSSTVNFNYKSKNWRTHEMSGKR